MIPLKVEQYLATVSGDVDRADPKAAEKVLVSLGVDSGSEFGEFYLKYQGGLYQSSPGC